MKKKRYNRGTRGLQRLLYNLDASQYMCKEVQEDIETAMREAAKDFFNNLPICDFDLVLEPMPIKEDI